MITLTNLEKGYSIKKTIIEVPDMTFHRGDMVALVGPNGSGKSTLLTMMTGLLDPTRGTITIDDHAPGSRQARKLLSFVPDKPALFDDLTVGEQIDYVARVNGLNEPNDVSERLLDVLGVRDLLDRFPHSLSKGQRQKASIVVAAARPFDALLLDEPTSGLDTDSTTGLIGLFDELASDGTLIITCTHLGEMSEAATRVARIVDGTLIDGEAGYHREGEAGPPIDQEK